MRLFGITEARHYCSSFTGTPGYAGKSIESFQQHRLGKQSRIIREGTQLFSEYRDCSLRDVERCLLFAASHYRRCLDLMIPSASPWALVTVYYGIWYASRALLGMFGCTIVRNLVIDVQKSSPGQQELRLRRIGNYQGQQQTTYKGSHRIFWDLFYTAVISLRTMVAPKFAAALSPVKGDPVWLIEQRNEVNYDSWIALGFIQHFGSSFSKHRFPGSLPGSLVTQFSILELLLELTYSYASQFNVQTDALIRIGQYGSLRDKVSELVYKEKAPGLVRKTKKSIIT